jgi:uncharacterized protein involved in type VI secretion and phage assembly
MTIQSTGLADFAITLDGQLAPRELRDDVRQIIVESSIHAPSLFELHVFCTQQQGIFRWMDATPDNASFQLGTRVDVAALPVPIEGNDDAGVAPITLIRGVVTTLETNFTEDGDALLTVRGYDATHALHRGRKTATFLKMTDSEIVAKVARDAGLDVDADSTPTVHEYVLQYNQTDMAFLQSRARRVGFDLFIDLQRVLHFTPIAANHGRPVTLEWGRQLRQFQARIGSGRQARNVVVRSWDAHTRQLVEAVYTPPDSPDCGGAALQDDLAAARTQFARKPANAVTLNRPVTAMRDAEAMARSMGQAMMQEFVEASGVCAGHPDITAGVQVELAGIGQRMSGVYRVTSATHTYRQDEEYLTEFTISSRVNDSITALITDDANAVSESLHSVVIGIVTNLTDPRKLGRVKVKFPWMGDAPGIESAWCRMAAPMAGPGRGWMSLPEINDEVLVAFEHGDVNVPFIVGALWNQQDPPPRSSDEAVADSAVKDSVVNLRVWRSRSGHELLFDDTDGKERVVLSDKTGNNKIEIDSNEDKLTVKVDGDCLIQSKGNLTLDSNTGDMTLRCNAFSLNAKGNCDLSSPKFDFNKGALEIT